MQRWKHTAVLFLTGIMTAAMPTASFAAKDKKITSVSLEITSNIAVGEDMNNDSIEVEGGSERYSVDSWEILNPGFEWEENDTPQIKVYLTAADGYYFSLTSSKVKLKGAKYVTASKKDSSTTLMITMNLPSLAESVGEIEETFLGEDGIAWWEPVSGAGSYEVRVQRDGKNTGSVMNVTQEKCNIRIYLGKPGVYTVKARPVNRIKKETKGRWVESNNIYIDSELAAGFRAGRVKDGGRWEEKDGIWRYRNADGSYQTTSWKKIEEIWYYFDANGYMQTGWIQVDGKEYYCDSSGAMLHDTIVDGRQLGSDGAAEQ